MRVNIKGPHLRRILNKKKKNNNDRRRRSVVITRLMTPTAEVAAQSLCIRVYVLKIIKKNNKR